MITEEDLTRWSEIVEANPGMYPNALFLLIEEVRRLREALKEREYEKFTSYLMDE